MRQKTDVPPPAVGEHPAPRRPLLLLLQGTKEFKESVCVSGLSVGGPVVEEGKCSGRFMASIHPRVSSTCVVLLQQRHTHLLALRTVHSAWYMRLMGKKPNELTIMRVSLDVYIRVDLPPATARSSSRPPCDAICPCTCVCVCGRPNVMSLVMCV